MVATYIHVLYDFLVYPDTSASFFLCKGKCSQSALQNTSRLILPARLKYMNLVVLVDCQQNQLNISAVFCVYCSISYNWYNWLCDFCIATGLSLTIYPVLCNRIHLLLRFTNGL